MLQILAWRLGFEFWNLFAAIVSIDRWGVFKWLTLPVDYFAFGANLDPAVLQRRRMRVQTQSEFLVRDWEMRFTQQGPVRGAGFASLEEAPGKAAFGHLLTLTRIDAIRMDFSELVPIFKRHRRVTITQDDRTFYFYQASSPVDGLLPTAEYKAKILQAAERSQIIPTDLLAELRGTPVVARLDLATDIGLFVDLGKARPRLLHAVLRRYEGWCLYLFRHVLRWSLADRLIRMDR